MTFFHIAVLACVVTQFLGASATSAVEPSTGAKVASPNVLFIAIDDLNDWIGPLGGNPQVKTPNIDRLAKRGMLFTNAHCAAPLCNPSRAAVFSGRQPFETGVFANDEKAIRKVHPELVLIPQHFKLAGYRTFGTGKLLHQKGTGMYDEEFFPEQYKSPFTREEGSYTDAELPSKGTENPRHVVKLKGNTVVLPLNRMPSDRAPKSKKMETFDWGPLAVDDADMGDGQIADWSSQRLAKNYDQPFFMAVGFVRPHIPLFAPKKYFDLYDGMTIQLPEVKADDLNDLSETGKKWALEPVTAGAHANVVKHNQWAAAVKSYMACVSFVDAQIGKMLDALDAGPNASNTLIVMWSDHGWHLGEKEHWGKWTGWQRATRVPLIIAPPKCAPRGAFQIGGSCAEPVGLIDLYPSLIDLCHLPAREGLSGQSLAPYLKDPHGDGKRVILTTFDDGNFSATAARWHYIRYADSSEELYDSQADPHEWTNLAGQPQSLPIQRELSARMPPVPKNPPKKSGPARTDPD